MLTLTRHLGDGLILNDGEIVLRVHKITPTRVELSIDVPREMPVRRGEAAAGFRLQPQQLTTETRRHGA